VRPGWLRGARISWRAFKELASLVSSISILAVAVVWLTQQWHSHQDWRPSEYAKVDNLRSTRLIAKVRSDFGEPAARRSGPQGINVEYFHRHDYWVQVFYARASGSVLGWTITACKDDFRPKFTFPLTGNEYTLWRTKLNALPALPKTEYADFWRQITLHQPNKLIEAGEGPGTFGFVNLVFGVADVCGPAFPEAAKIIYESTRSAPASFFMYQGPAKNCRQCAAIASKATINTYGELYSPGRGVDWYDKRFGLGTPREIALGFVPY
jgi:hypothetical protein